jgi:hypothetical protein
VIATNYVGAILTSFWFKRWEWARPKDSYLPIRGYLASALTAFGFASLTSFSLGLLSRPDVLQTWRLLYSKFWAWSLMSAVVAASVAYLIDQRERPGMRAKETATLALICAFCAIPVVYLLHSSCGGCAHPPPYWRVTIMSALTGGLIGFFVPTWYRTPLKTVSWYEHFKIVGTTRTDSDSDSGEVVADIKVFSPSRVAGARLSAELPSIVDLASTNDAIANAVRSARAWIKAQQATQADTHIARPLAPPSQPKRADAMPNTRSMIVV